MITQVVIPITSNTSNVKFTIKDTHGPKKKPEFKIIKYSKNIILFVVVYMLLTYLGKVYIYLICGPTCDTEDRFITKKNSTEVIDKCTCYKNIEINNYWSTYNNSLIEATFAFVINSLVYVCCCKRCK